MDLSVPRPCNAAVDEDTADPCAVDESEIREGVGAQPFDERLWRLRKCRRVRSKLATRLSCPHAIVARVRRWLVTSSQSYALKTVPDPKQT